MYVFVVDIDGTVADTRARVDAICRKYNVKEEDWEDEQIKEFVSDESIKKDVVIPGAENLASLARQCGAKIIFFTGRSERARNATRLWLKSNLNIFDSVPIVMRPLDDYRSTADCKEEMFRKTVFEIYKDAKFVFFEDDEELLNRLSKYGLTLKAPDCWKVIRFAKNNLQIEEN